jgi:hypothetical protein
MPYFPPAGGSGLATTGGTMTGTITSTIGTITANTPMITGTQTWNASGTTFYGIYQDITNTASASGSRLIDLRVGGSSQFAVTTGGQVRAGVASTTVPIYTAPADSGTGFGVSGSNGAYIYTFSDVIAYWRGNDVFHRAATIIGWTAGNATHGNALDSAWARTASGVIQACTGTAGTYAAVEAKEFRFRAPTSANGQYAAVLSLTELTTIAAAATTDTTIQMPANAIILAVSVRVTTAIPTATNFTVGDSGSATRFSTAAVSSALNSTDPGTKAGAYYNASATSVRITPDATPGANTGRVRVTIHYILVTPPTS